MLITPIWRLNRPHFDPRELEVLGFGRLLSVVLAARFPTAEDAYKFATSYSTAPPSSIVGLTEASRLILRHALQENTILVSGDYDVDGICSTAMLVLWLKQLGAPVQWYLPSRSVGYGFNQHALEKAKGIGAALIIVVDSGTNDIETCAAAREDGFDVVILDHHEPLYGRPPVTAYVNPRYYGNGAQHYCAAGLTYKLIEDMGLRLKRPVPAEFALLAAIATVADVVPLVGENRYLARRGLELWPLVSLPGIAALREVMDAPHLTADTFAFMVGPRFNAPGRLATPDLTLELLLAERHDQARDLAVKLEEINRQRQAMTYDALARLQGRLVVRPEDKAILAADETVPYGLAGIIAGHLARQYNRPAIMLSQDKGMWRGSGRAPGGYDLVKVLSAAREYFYTFGGHPQAVGLSVRPEHLAPLREVLNRLLPPPQPPAFEVDTILKAGDRFSLEEVAELRWLAPHGYGNPEPLFLFRGVHPLYASRTSTGEHVRFKVGDTWFIWFGGAEAFESYQPPLDIVFNLDVNHYNGRLTVQGVAKAAAPSITLTREVLGMVYQAISDNGLDGLSKQYREALAPALAILQELELVRYDGDEGRLYVVTPSEKKDLYASRTFLAYAGM